MVGIRIAELNVSIRYGLLEIWQLIAIALLRLESSSDTLLE